MRLTTQSPLHRTHSFLMSNCWSGLLISTTSGPQKLEYRQLVAANSPGYVALAKVWSFANAAQVAALISDGTFVFEPLTGHDEFDGELALFNEIETVPSALDSTW